MAPEIKTLVSDREGKKTQIPLLAGPDSRHLDIKLKLILLFLLVICKKEHREAQSRQRLEGGWAVRYIQTILSV